MFLNLRIVAGLVRAPPIRVHALTASFCIAVKYLLISRASGILTGERRSRTPDRVQKKKTRKRWSGDGAMLIATKGGGVGAGPRAAVHGDVALPASAAGMRGDPEGPRSCRSSGWAVAPPREGCASQRRAICTRHRIAIAEGIARALEHQDLLWLYV